MKSVLAAVIVSVVSLSIAGCSISGITGGGLGGGNGGNAGGGGSGGSVGGEGNGGNVGGGGQTLAAAAQTAFQAYTPVLASDPAITVTDLQQKPGGLSGIAASSTGSVAAVTNSQGTFKVATISMAADGGKLDVIVDGQKFSLDRLDNPPLGFAAASLGVTSYWFGPGPSVVGNKANIYNQTYSSLTAFGRDVNDTSKTLAGYVLVATGAETPAAGIPAQLATYEGAWLLLLESGGPVNTVIAARDGTFTAEADFANKSLEYNVLIGGSSAGSGSAAITGNRFLGEFTTSMSDFDERKFTGGGTIAGAFYGPDAEEMAGVLAGSASTAGGESAVVSGGFFGQKK